MDATAIVDFIAGVLTTISFLPQVLKTIRTKSTRDISLGMYLILAIGIVIWFVYSVLMNSLPVTLSERLYNRYRQIPRKTKVKKGKKYLTLRGGKGKMHHLAWELSL
jgi:MtN3 and saliva related transmembrane protein